MTPMIISMQAGHRLYLNGAVVQARRRIVLELLNTANFLLQRNVIPVDQATTPCRQMYFVMQTILMDPKNATRIRPLLPKSLEDLMAAFDDPEAMNLLRSIGELLARDKLFEAMKTTKALFEIEDRIIEGKSALGILAAAMRSSDIGRVEETAESLCLDKPSRDVA